MTKQDYLDLGFKELEHYTVMDSLHYDLGRGRYLSAGSVGTPNEMIFICQKDRKKPKNVTDIIVLSNYDYDGIMDKDRLEIIIKLIQERK